MWDQTQVVNLLSAISSKIDSLSSKLDLFAAAQAQSYQLLTLLTASFVLAAFIFILSRWFKK